MSDPKTTFRLEGLAPDNLLAFLALLGILRSLEAIDRNLPEAEQLYPRASWDRTPPDRPLLHLRRPLKEAELLQIVECGMIELSGAHRFDDRMKLDYSAEEARQLLTDAATQATAKLRDRADLFASLMTDAAVKEVKSSTEKVGRDKPAELIINPTPFCLMSGGGQQYFLERLSRVPANLEPPIRDGAMQELRSNTGARHRKARRPETITVTPEESLREALFQRWHRDDPKTSSFRWDPAEDARYALMPGNPTDEKYKTRTQYGANRLAAIGLPTLTVVPESRDRRDRRDPPTVVGGSFVPGKFTFRWPIWREPASLAAIRALLMHPGLGHRKDTAHLGVDYVMTTRLISNGDLRNFTTAKASA